MTQSVSQHRSPDGSGGVTRTVKHGDGRSVAYAEYGAPSGRPLLVFHGTPGSRTFGSLLDDCAREHDVRVVAIDRPGYGRSDPWPGFDAGRTGDLVDPVVADADIERAGVLGFSGGAASALGLAVQRPDLVERVDLVSAAAPPSLQETTPSAMRLLAGMARRTPRLLGGLLRAQSWLGSRTSDVVVGQYSDPAEVPESVAEAVTADFREAMRETRAGAIREFGQAGAAWPVSPSAVERPVRLWHGGADENVPIEGVRRLAERLPQARLTVFEAADHLQTLLRSRSRIVENLEGQGADQRSSSSSMS